MTFSESIDFDRLATFLKRAGLTLKQSYADSFRSYVYEFGTYGGTKELAFLVRRELHTWVVVQDLRSPMTPEYDVAILRDFLGGSGPDVPPCDEQVDWLVAHWDAIRAAFADDREAATHARLKELTVERWKRRTGTASTAGQR